MGPEDLDQVLRGLNLSKDPRILVGLETSDDAGVYLLNDEIALVQTADFFTPIVDDPFTFGQIAVVNALSDVYAMGGKPLTALNLVAFPIKSVSSSVLREILRGGLSKMEEAEVALVGGHSIEDPEIKYGLAVTGIVHPQKILTNAKARPGDQLILTKPLGTGVISTALKGEMASEQAVREMVQTMLTLNREASERMVTFGAHACTDITGFGLIGHALEMAVASEVGLSIRPASLPFLPKVLEYAGMGLIPAGAYSNRQFFSCKVEVGPDVDPLLIDLLYDPQTSGGLLVSVPPDKAQEMLAILRQDGSPNASLVGEVLKEAPGRIKIIP